MEHFLADQGLRAICLHDVSEMDGRDQARMRADLWDGGIANAVVPGRRWLDLEEQDFVVLVSDFQRNRCLGLLTATERSTEREPFLLVEAAYVAPSARGRNLLQRMVAFAVLCIARYDRIPSLVAACAQGEACRRNLSDVQKHFRAASVFPRPDEAAIDLGMAGLAQRIARVIRPGARYEAGSGAFRASSVAPWDRASHHNEQTLVVLDLGAKDDASIVKDARRLYRTRPSRAAVRDDCTHGVAADAMFARQRFLEGAGD